MIHTEKVYVDKSIIPNIGKGLFAKKYIKKNEIIAELLDH